MCVREKEAGGKGSWFTIHVQGPGFGVLGVPNSGSTWVPCSSERAPPGDPIVGMRQSLDGGRRGGGYSF